ncbi:MAG: hypothetical protein Q9165_003088 [Trypethelium subeluteriae]
MEDDLLRRFARWRSTATPRAGILVGRTAGHAPTGYEGWIVHNEDAPNAEMSAHGIRARERMRALANWDPSYPNEKIDFYQEYIHRHAPITMNWLQTASDVTGGGNEHREATGIGLLREDGEYGAEKAVAPLDDGSICVFDISPWSGHGPKSQGRILSRSESGLLTRPPTNLDQDSARERSKTMMTETGAVECVSIDSIQRKGFFAVQNALNEVDLNTMQVISRNRFPFPITALSEAKPSIPLTVGTNMTLHLHDPRQPSISPISSSFSSGSSARCELIAGSSPPGLSPLNLSSSLPPAPHSLPISAITGSHNPPSAHATLSQPGPLSILHLPESRAWDGNGSIWVAGRFTSLLNYDRRFFPRLRGTLHSGARLSSLALLPFPYLPRETAIMRSSLSSSTTTSGLSIADVHAAKSIPGHTLLAAGEYKGKGSLELYGLSPEPHLTTLSTDALATPRTGRTAMDGGVGRRQTSYQNRQTASASKLLAVATHGARVVFADGDGGVKWVERDGCSLVRTWNVNDAKTPTLLRGRARGGEGSDVDSGYASERERSRGRDEVAATEGTEEPNDIVQKLVPTTSPGVNNSNLLVWTGDGRLGLLGFGRRALFSEDEWQEGEALSEEARREEDKAREYAGRMRRALERQADEVRFVRGMGLPGW